MAQKIYEPIVCKAGKLTLARAEMAFEFYCERCQNSKKAKLVAKWEKKDGTVDQICNGCYGLLRSQG